VPASRDIIEAAGKRVAAYCAQRSSSDDYRIEHSIRGASITIVERRPPWNPAFRSEWSSTKVAQLRYDEGSRRWTVYSAGSDERWHRYDFARPGSDVAPLLAAIDDDITGIFWG
jgi:hypothetical protein